MMFIVLSNVWQLYSYTARRIITGYEAVTVLVGLHGLFQSHVSACRGRNKMAALLQMTLVAKGLVPSQTTIHYVK